MKTGEKKRITTDGGRTVVTLSPLGYVHHMLEEDEDTNNLNAVSALYYFYKATADYSAVHMQ